MQITFSPDALGSETPELVLEKLIGFDFEVTTKDGVGFWGELIGLSSEGLLFSKKDDGSESRISLNREEIQTLEIV